MRALSRIVVLLFVFFGAADASATSRIYFRLWELIRSSDAIAVVVVDVPHGEARDAEAKALVTRVSLKQRVHGDLPESFLIHDGRGRDDHLFQQGAGDYVVFLQKKGDRYFPANYWPSSKPIKEGKVLGWSNHPTDETDRELQAAVTEIKAVLTNKRCLPKLTIPEALAKAELAVGEEKAERFVASVVYHESGPMTEPHKGEGTSGPYWLVAYELDIHADGGQLFVHVYMDGKTRIIGGR